MNGMLKLILCVLTICICQSGIAQLERSHIFPSPNASPIVGGANVEMNHYTGAANVTIPLHSIQGKDISIPIMLNYQTSGIKVNTVSTSVGLGWSLNANAFAVTRVVRGLPDGSKINCDTDASGKVSRGEVWDTNFETCDAEHDIFYFSYPSRSGKFFLDNSGQPQTMPYQDILISPGVGSASVGYWKITDELGYTYYFGENENSREGTTYYVGDRDAGSFTQKDTFISTWYLTRIVSPKGANVATFSYHAGSNVSYYNTAVRVLDCTTPIDGIEYKRIDTKIQINSPKYISSIVTSIASCSFAYDNNRTDLPGALRLASISFKDHTNTEKKKYHLEPGCFPVYLSFGACRLKLQSIKEGLSVPVTTHTFLYSEYLLPPMESLNTDHYGYYNARSSDDELESGGYGHADRSVATVTGICDWGRNKNPNEGAFGATLKEIQLASGARTTFSYDVQVGARLITIANYNGSSLVGRSSFSYIGETYKSPVYHYYNTEGSDLLIRSSNAYNSIFDLNGVSKGYGTVTETLLDGSKIVRTFYNFSDYPDDPPIVGRYRGTSMVTFQGSSNVDSSPFTPYSSKAWMRGLPKSITIMDNQSNPLHKEEFFYEPGAILSTVWNMAVEAYRTVPTDFGFYVGDYMLRSQHVYLDYKNTYVYDQTDFTKYQLETTLYSYHDKHKTFPDEIDVNCGPHSRRVTFKYPIDLIHPVDPTGTAEPTNAEESAAGVWSLSKNHIITPIEQLQYRKDEATLAYKIIGGAHYTYRKNAVNNKPLLKEVYSLNRASAEASFTPASFINGGATLVKDGNFRLVQRFMHNDASAGDNVTMISTTGSDGLTRNYEYDDNNTLITAEYSSLGSTEFKNQYVYNTVNGLLSETDENSQTTSYEYDNFGRLKLLRDNSGDIVTRYRYNTKNTNEFTIVINSPDFAPTNQEVTFTAGDGETAGITKYIWDFGDGQVVEGTSPVVSHTYSTVGTYTIKLAKVNPEYGKLFTSKEVTVYTAPTVTLTSSCEPIDLCSQTYCETSVAGSGGCSALTYSWYYRPAGGEWVYFSSGPHALFSPEYEDEGSYNVRCVVSDTCGATDEAIQTIQVYRSTPDCQ